MSAPTPSGLNVLIADADAAAVSAIREALAVSHPTACADVAGSGPELFENLQRKKYHILLLNTFLRDVDIETLHRVLAFADARKAMRLILLMDRLRPQWARLGYGLNAYEILLKPLLPDVVALSLSGCLEAMRPRSVLVVDPSPCARGVVTRMLQSSQFAVTITEAESGRAALRQIDRQTFDIALVDFELTDMPALEIATQIVESSRETTQVLMMGIGPERARGLTVFGVASFLEKPFGPSELDERLHGALGLWRPYLLKALRPSQ